MRLTSKSNALPVATSQLDKLLNTSLQHQSWCHAWDCLQLNRIMWPNDRCKILPRFPLLVTLSFSITSSTVARRHDCPHLLDDEAMTNSWICLLLVQLSSTRAQLGIFMKPRTISQFVLLCLALANGKHLWLLFGVVNQISQTGTVKKPNKWLLCS